MGDLIGHCAGAEHSGRGRVVERAQREAVPAAYRLRIRPSVLRPGERRYGMAVTPGTGLGFRAFQRRADRPPGGDFGPAQWWRATAANCWGACIASTVTGGSSASRTPFSFPTRFAQPGRVARYAPDGSIDCTIDVSASQPSCIAFGGPDMNLLFVTSARDGLKNDMLLRQPNAGNLFVYTTDITGLPDADFIFDQAA